MQIIDTRRQLCPAPLILTKRTIKSTPQGGQFTVITDNDTARRNLLSFLSEMGLQTSCVAHGDDFHISFATDGTNSAIPPVDDFCETTNTGSHIIVFKGETMGQGSDELGALLMRSCINSLPEIEPLPRVMIFYNAAVMLATQQRDTAQTIEKLALQGVKILVCGACVDFFGIKNKLTPAAEISNMYTINTMLATASSIMYP